MGRFETNNHREQFEEEAGKLSYNRIQDRQKRLLLIDNLIEEYIEDTGMIPDGRQLERLASAILYEDLQGDTRPDKVALEEYPILTYSQIKRRHGNEASSEVLEVIGSDGRNHSRSRQRKLTISEEIQREEDAAKHPKNKAFREARRPGKVITYKLDEVIEGNGKHA